MQAPQHNHRARIDKLRTKLRAEDLTALLISDPINRAYLSGFEGSAGYLILTQSEAVLLTDFRYTEQATSQAPEYRVLRHSAEVRATIAEVLDEMGVQKLGFESTHLTYHQHAKLAQELTGVDFIPTEGIVEELRAVKDGVERKLIEEAVRIADEAFASLVERGVIRAGVTELEVANELERELRRFGAEGPAFPFIVASGPRSALPHGQATSRTIEKGDFVTIDFGARYRGYNSDCTRTLVVGPASPKQREIYELVYRAHKNVAANIGPGMTGAEADSLARNIIDGAGYGDAFGHGLGHGIGRAVHEAPSVSQRNPDKKLLAGNVVSNEPGIYLPGWGGVRIEDLIIITADGSETLTQLGYRELTELPIG